MIFARLYRNYALFSFARTRENSMHTKKPAIFQINVKISQKSSILDEIPALKSTMGSAANWAVQHGKYRIEKA